MAHLPTAAEAQSHSWSYVSLSPSPSVPSCRVLSVCREPVNSMNAQLWRELSEALQQLDHDSAAQAVIIQSTLKKDCTRSQQQSLHSRPWPLSLSLSHDGGSYLFLCVGLLSVSAPPRAERYSSFWRSQTECLARLYRSRLLTIAAIRGSCPAGGCILALCCDYRLLTANGSMGLNEAALSMPVPDYWMRVMSRTVGWRRTEAMLQKGLLLDASQAKQCGLVDEVVDDGAALLSAAEREAAERLKVPEVGRTASKRLMREQLSQEWEAQWRSEADSSWKLLSADETVTQIRRVLQRLSANKATNAQQHKPAKL